MCVWNLLRWALTRPVEREAKVRTGCSHHCWFSVSVCVCAFLWPNGDLVCAHVLFEISLNTRLCICKKTFSLHVFKVDIWVIWTWKHATGFTRSRRRTPTNRRGSANTWQDHDFRLKLGQLERLERRCLMSKTLFSHFCIKCFIHQKQI